MFLKTFIFLQLVQKLIAFLQLIQTFIYKFQSKMCRYFNISNLLEIYFLERQ